MVRSCFIESVLSGALADHAPILPISRLSHTGIIQGFRNGKLPSNKQIDETMDYFLTHSPFEEGKLSREGQELIEGFRKVVRDANEMIKVKNQDEWVDLLFQSKRRACD
jgi:hypothetical protein